MHYALVHGAYHGAWCWERLRAELERAGDTTSAVDLPNDDPNAGAEQYADQVIHGIPVATQDIVLVGHSLGGLTIPVVAGRVRVRMTVYLCAMLPVPGLSFDMQQADFSAGFTPSAPAFANPDGSASWPEQGAVETFYQDCDPAVARAAARRLSRQHWRITQEVTPLRQWPAVPASYILCAEDRAIAPAYSRQASRELLGVEPIEMRSGHSPFLSCPKELASVLAEITAAARA
jgi:pimeloyl-ACP methyl ester carboxylesterase